MSVTVWQLQNVEYVDGLELMRQLIARRQAGTGGDNLLLLEHPAVLTMGRGAKATNILASAETMARAGVELFETDRGGDVTYHGPGQLVGYPLLYLPPGRQDVRRYVRSIEEIAIRTVADFGVTAERIEKWPGVWVKESKAGGPRKICAVGVHLSRWHTRHGFALNVAPNLSHFSLIVPCGIKEASVTSLAAELGSAPSMTQVRERVAYHFSQVFDWPIESAPPLASTISVVVMRGSKVLLLKRVASKGGFWQPVTGWVEAGENPSWAAQRELREETGSEAPVRPLDYVHEVGLGDRVIQETAFVARDEGNAEVQLSHEHEAFEWVSVEEALRRVPFKGFERAISLAANGGHAPVWHPQSATASAPTGSAQGDSRQQ